MSDPQTTDPEDLPPLPTSHRPASESRRFSLATGPQSTLAKLMDDLAADVPEEEWAKLPKDMAAQASQTTNGWQPIETAPKDGTNVILYGSYESKPGEPFVVAGMSWDSEPVGWTNGDCWATEVGDRWVPTHWHPLPCPPEDANA